MSATNCSRVESIGNPITSRSQSAAMAFWIFVQLNPVRFWTALVEAAVNAPVASVNAARHKQQAISAAEALPSISASTVAVGMQKLPASSGDVPAGVLT